MQFGPEVEIWRDTKLTGNDISRAENRRAVPEDRAVGFCAEPALFEIGLVPARGGRVLCRRRPVRRATCQNKSRIVKVVKLPVDQKGLPAAALDVSLRGFNFYVDRGSKAALEMDPGYGLEMIPLFNTQLADLAAELAQTLEKLAGNTAPRQPSDGPPKPVVYLAECGYDRSQERQLLRSELRTHGYEILPDRDMPSDEQAYVREAAAMLHPQAQLSVHLIGSDCGLVPYGRTGASAPVIQNDLAIQRCREEALERMIWLPSDTGSENAVQQRFIDRLAPTPMRSSGQT